MQIPAVITAWSSRLQPRCGWRELLIVYMNWSSVGFISVFVADLLDQLSGVAYAAHYTDAVNAAIGIHFWLLISMTGLLIFCLILPFVYIQHHTSRYIVVSQRMRNFCYFFFLVAYDEGALMLGILLAILMGVSDRADLLVSKSFLFSEQGMWMIPVMLIGNSLLWWLGESIFNRIDGGVSGLVDFVLMSPLKYSLPSFLLAMTSLVTILLQQSA